jgi:hypothetical protein
MDSKECCRKMSSKEDCRKLNVLRNFRCGCFLFSQILNLRLNLIILQCQIVSAVSSIFSLIHRIATYAQGSLISWLVSLPSRIKTGHISGAVHALVLRFTLISRWSFHKLWHYHRNITGTVPPVLQHSRKGWSSSDLFLFQENLYLLKRVPIVNFKGRTLDTNCAS